MSSLAEMKEFLDGRRIALVGVSRDTKQFANALMRAMAEAGYEVVPVNPHATTLEGRDAYPSVRAVPGGVDGVILLLPPAAIAPALDDCLSAGVPRIWFRSASGPGAAAELIDRARLAGVEVIDGGCPFMALPGTHWFHRAHTSFARWTGAITP